MKRISFIFVAAALASMSLVGCGKSGATTGSAEVATINNVKIDSGEFLRYMMTKGSVEITTGALNSNDRAAIAQRISAGQAVSVPSAGAVGLQALTELMRHKLLLQLAQDEGVSPTDDEIKAEIEHRMELDSGFIRGLEQQGYAMEDIRNLVKISLAQSNLLTKGITVTDEEVQKYIDGDKSLTTEPATATLLMVGAQTQATRDSFDSAFASGQKFEDVAGQFNDDPSLKAAKGKFNQGRPVNMDTLGEPLQVAIDATGINKATDWIQLPPNEQGQSAHVKLFILAKTKEKPREMTEARKAQIKRGLAEQRGREGKDIDGKLLDAFLGAEIEVRDENLKRIWNNYEQRVLEPQRTERNKS